jgi:hypothetical protein
VVTAMVAAQLKEILMTKAKRKPTSRANDSKTQSRNSVRRTSARKVAPLKPVTTATQATTPRESKKAHLIAMLRAPNGATIKSMALAAKWQPHSVRVRASHSPAPSRN